MENTITWLLIADASKARIFSLHKARFIQDQKPDNLHLIGEYSHNQSRQKGSDLVTDRMGMYGSGNFSESTPPKVHEAEVFAHQLMEHLDNGRKDGVYRDLILIAPPAFMGILHKSMPHGIQKLVSQNIEKDYTQSQGHELARNLISHF
jgi:protein required for attachment to host cells